LVETAPIFERRALTMSIAVASLFDGALAGGGDHRGR
jgi:hypothetical protein